MFTIICGTSKRFNKQHKDLIKPISGTKGRVKIKIYIKFFPVQGKIYKRNFQKISLKKFLWNI